MNAATKFFQACRQQRTFPAPSCNPSRALPRTQQRQFTTSLPHRSIATTALSPTEPTKAVQDSIPTSSSSSSTTPSSLDDDSSFLSSSFVHIGRVTRTSTMAKTVRVTRNIQHFDKFLRKHYTRPHSVLVRDPEEILVEGDVITYGLLVPSERKKRVEEGRLKGDKGVRFGLREVVTPFGRPVEDRVSRAVARAQEEEERANGGVKRVVRNKKVKRAGKAKVIE